MDATGSGGAGGSSSAGGMGGGDTGGGDTGGGDTGGGDMGGAGGSVEPCSTGSCQVGLGCEPGTQECLPCGSLAPDAVEAFVNALGPTWGTGTLLCPVRTVTEGVALLSASSAADRTLHVAAGLYDEDQGETFPITLPGQLSLVGAGSDATTLRGSSPLLNPLGTMGPIHLTVRAGSPTGTSRVEGVRIEPEVGVTSFEHVGVLCDEGNAPLLYVPAPIPAAASLEIVDVHIGPGFGVGVVASSQVSSGCSLSLRSSVVDDNTFGLWALGCGYGVAEGGNPTNGVTVQIGAPGEGNLIQGHHAPSPGVGVVMWDCVNALIVEDNTFTDNDEGIGLGYHDAIDGSETTYVRIENNTFSFHSVAGVGVGVSSTVHELIGNTFTDNIDSSSAQSAALLLGPQPGFLYPRVLRARSNTFQDNEIGIDFQDLALISATRLSDLGTAADAGFNVVSCNTLDVVVRANGATPGLVLPFAGNRWDHDPPTQFQGTTPPFGTDVTRLSATALQIDAQDAGLVPTPCP